MVIFMIKKIISDDIINMNVYLLIDENKAFIVDPGGNYDEIEKTIKKDDLTIIGILLTHAHVDHTYLINRFNCPIYIHEKEVEILKYSNLSLYDSFNLDMPFSYRNLNIIKLKDNDEIPFNDKTIKVIHTPGHTKGSCCYLYNNKLFSGDTLFKESCGRCDLPTGSETDMAKSLIELIDNLDESTKVYPGHDESTTIGYEKLNNYQYKYYKKMFN